MKGYIYVSGTGSDTYGGKFLNDPAFGRRPTLGACMPNIRRLVVPGDWVFVVSGSLKGVQQYVVGGFEVAEKINAVAAYERFPEHRLRINDLGQLEGNIIVTDSGQQSTLDSHNKFDERIQNYLVGGKSVSMDNENEAEASRQTTLAVLSGLFDKPGNRVIDVMGRWRRLDEDQIFRLETWLSDIKRNTD